MKRFANISDHLGTESVDCAAEDADALYLATEKALLAAVVMGAEALRICRRFGRPVPEPICAVHQAATLVSYHSLTDMPPELEERCGWLSPESDLYDWRGRRLSEHVYTSGAARANLIFRLFESHGAHNLRQATFADIPILTEEESSRLLGIIADIQLDPDPDMPLLAWYDEAQELRTSWELTGQQWAAVDLDGVKALPLPDPTRVEMSAEGDLFANNYYVSDPCSWRLKGYLQRKRMRTANTIGLPSGTV